MSCPSGDRMQTRDEPPTRKSILATGEVKPFGPHQRMTYSGSLQTFQTRSAGALNTRVTTRSLVFKSCSGRLIVFAAPEVECWPIETTNAVATNVQTQIFINEFFIFSFPSSATGEQPPVSRTLAMLPCPMTVRSNQSNL